MHAQTGHAHFTCTRVKRSKKGEAFMHADSVIKLRELAEPYPEKKGVFFIEFGWDFVTQCPQIVENQIECVNFNTRSLITQWSDPRINFVFVIHKHLFVFVHAIRLCGVPVLNFVHWHKRES